MVSRKVMSQCISKDYCQGWNDAVDEMEKSQVHAHVVINWLSGCRCSRCKGHIDGRNNYCNWCGAMLDEPEQIEKEMTPYDKECIEFVEKTASKIIGDSPFR